MSGDIQPFKSPRHAALALLSSETPLSYKEGGFLGSVIVIEGELSSKQRGWLDDIIERAGMPPMSN